MNMREKPSSDSATVPNRSSASVPPQNNLYIFATIAETTWRLFVPTLGLLGLGIWFASSTGRDKAVWALVGVLVGAALGYALVYQQYRKAKSGERK